MIGFSPSMVEIYKTVARVAPTDATVIIEGENRHRQGDGGAVMIHRRQLAPRKRSICPGGLRIDCALPDGVCELFGAMRRRLHWR